MASSAPALTPCTLGLSTWTRSAWVTCQCQLLEQWMRDAHVTLMVPPSLRARLPGSASRTPAHFLLSCPWAGGPADIRWFLNCPAPSREEGSNLSPPRSLGVPGGSVTPVPCSCICGGGCLLYHPQGDTTGPDRNSKGTRFPRLDPR
jgi:hypothetical protein